MESCILMIVNDALYPEASRILREIGYALGEMGYGLHILMEEEGAYEKKLESFLGLMQTEIECRAILTCNAISAGYIASSADCVYATFLLEGYNLPSASGELRNGNQDTVVYCTDPKDMEPLRAAYPNIGEILYADLRADSDEGRFEAEAGVAFDMQELIAVRRGTASSMKLLLQRALDARNLPYAKRLLEQYQRECPADLDVIAMETIYGLYSGNLDAALEYGLEGIRKYPCNGDLYYNLGNVYEAREEWFWACFSYGRAAAIYSYAKKSRKIERLRLMESIGICHKKYQENQRGDLYQEFEVMWKNDFGLRELSFRDVNCQILGKYFWESATEKRYAGIYRGSMVVQNRLDVMHVTGEFVKVTEGNEVEVPNGGTDVLLPIATEDNNTMHKIIHEGREHFVHQLYDKHFCYYRIPPNSKIVSSGKSYYGRPIPLRQEQDKKKLALHIFVDGLAQCILDGENFEKTMPHTARFFEKGTVCTRAYSAAEWTYPSMANYATGLNTAHHMMYHHTLDGSLPQGYPTLMEYFHEKGYFTAKMDGNWRDTPPYGYARGCDQFLYQNGLCAFRADEIIGGMIDHIEAFKETNQFFWTSIADLHDISDGYDMPNSVQSKIDIENCVYGDLGPTSVKQGYSENRRIAFEKMAGRIDLLLHALYQYIERNYDDNDILVSLFADHGQGYLVPEGEHFCAEGRSRVAFMFRGGDVPRQVCDEVISTCDYIKIMCKLADIQMKDIKIDGVLPKAFGGEGREYALVESIHPGDPYQAAIYAKDCVFYFKNSFPVQDDGRFYLKQCQVRLADLEGKDMDDDEKYQKYLSVILEHIAPLCIYD